MSGLYLSPRGHYRALPAGAVKEAPSRTLRFTTYNMARQHPGGDPMFARLARLSSDYLLLQGTEEDDALEVVERLQLQRNFHPQLFQRAERLAGQRGIWGNLIVARQELYAGAPIGGARGGFAVCAWSMVDGRAFLLVSAHLSPAPDADAEGRELKEKWQTLGRPPLVAGILPSDGALPPSLNFLPVRVTFNGQWIAATSEWAVSDQGAASSSGGGMAPVWADLRAAHQ